MEQGRLENGLAVGADEEAALDAVPPRSLDLVREVRELRRRAAEAQARSRALLHDLSEVRKTAEHLSSLVGGGGDD